MKLTNLLAVTTLGLAITSPIVMADDVTVERKMPLEQKITAEQKSDIEKIVHDYLINNPEVLLEASQNLQQKQQQAMQQQAQSAISENADQLFNEKMTVAGNPKGNVTVVEFFDYQCIHCKKMSPVIEALLKKDNNLRIIYKEFPIFGKSSEFASKVALSAAKQGKYQEMREALLKIDGRLDEKLIMDTAKSIGLNMVTLKKTMDSKPITDALDANRQLADKIHLMGTPAFIVASTPAGTFKAGSEPAFIPGAATEETLQELIKKSAGN